MYFCLQQTDNVFCLQQTDNAFCLQQTDNFFVYNKQTMFFVYTGLLKIYGAMITKTEGHAQVFPGFFPGSNQFQGFQGSVATLTLPNTENLS